MAYKSKYTGLQIDDILDSVESKQSEIEDLDSIRAGAAKGATALQSYTEKYTGTITGIKMNDETKGTEGIIDLGTVLIEHQDISGKQDVIPDLEAIREKAMSSLSSIPSNYVTDEQLSNKVDKISGKGLSSEDFTTSLKTKLESLNNYDDTELSNAIETLRSDLDELLGGNTTTAIETFNEIIAFLEGVADSSDLLGIIASIEQQIAGKQDAISDLDTIRDGASKGSTALQSHQDISHLATRQELENSLGLVNEDIASLAEVYATIDALNGKQDALVSSTNIKTINGESILGEGNLTVEGGATTYIFEWDGSESGTVADEVYETIYAANLVFIRYASMDIPATRSISDYVVSLVASLGGPAGLAISITFNGKNYTASIDQYSIPTSTSELTNDSGFITSAALTNYATIQDLERKQDTLVSGTNIKTINGESIVGSGDIVIEGGETLTESDIAAMGFTKNTGTYSKPSGGIPKTDLASTVQTSLDKADTALQSYTEQYKGTVTGVKINGTTKNPSSGVVDLGTVITSHQTLKTINGESIVGSGDITISSGNSDANIQAVDTGDVIDDVNVEYTTKVYVDGLVGDINSVLESIINS